MEAIKLFSSFFRFNTTTFLSLSKFNDKPISNWQHFEQILILYTHTPQTIKIGVQTQISSYFLFLYINTINFIGSGIISNYIYYNKNECANQSSIDFDETTIIFRLKNLDYNHGPVEENVYWFCKNG